MAWFGTVSGFFDPPQRRDMLRTGGVEQPLPQGKKFPYTNEQTRVTIFYLSRRSRRDHEEHEQFSKSDSQVAGEE
jgi:hypothetical protein